MKKLLTLLLAGVMTAGVVSFAACGNGDGFDKIPHIPDGVTLSDVALEDIEEKTDFFNKSVSSSKNLFGQEYLKYNWSTSYGVKKEREEYALTKYLEKDGKNYGEQILRDLSDTEEKNDEGKINYKYKYDSYRKNFLKDKTLGYISRGEESGYSIDSKTGEREDLGNKSNYLNLYLNGEDYRRTRYNGKEVEEGVSIIGGLGIAKEIGYDRHMRAYFTYGTKAHVNYMEDELQLAIGAPYSYGSDYQLLLYSYDIEVLKYNFVMQADDTKVYINQDYKFNLLSKGSNDVRFSVELNYIYYGDIESNLTEEDFDKDYLTAEDTANNTYLNGDVDKIKADVLAGNSVVIDIAGGGEKPADGDYETGKNEQAACTLTYLTDRGYIGGASVKNYSIVNGKLVLDVKLDELEENSLPEFKKNYERFVGRFPKDLDISTLKKVLVIKFPNNHYGSMYIYLD